MRVHGRRSCSSEFEMGKKCVGMDLFLWKFWWDSQRVRLKISQKNACQTSKRFSLIAHYFSAFGILEKNLCTHRSYHTIPLRDPLTPETLSTLHHDIYGSSFDSHAPPYPQRLWVGVVGSRVGIFPSPIQPRYFVFSRGGLCGQKECRAGQRRCTPRNPRNGRTHTRYEVSFRVYFGSLLLSQCSCVPATQESSLEEKQQQSIDLEYRSEPL